MMTGIHSVEMDVTQTEKSRKALFVQKEPRQLLQLVRQKMDLYVPFLIALIGKYTHFIYLTLGLYSSQNNTLTLT